MIEGRCQKPGRVTSSLRTSLLSDLLRIKIESYAPVGCRPISCFHQGHVNQVFAQADLQFVGAEHLYAISRTAVRTNLNSHAASNYLRAQPNFGFPGAPFKHLRRESFKTDKRISHRSVQASLNASRGPLGKSFDSSP